MDLAPEGHLAIEWAQRHSPLVDGFLRERLGDGALAGRPLGGQNGVPRDRFGRRRGGGSSCGIKPPFDERRGCRGPRRPRDPSAFNS